MIDDGDVLTVHYVNENGILSVLWEVPAVVDDIFVTKVVDSGVVDPVSTAEILPLLSASSSDKSAAYQF